MEKKAARLSAYEKTPYPLRAEQARNVNNQPRLDQAGAVIADREPKTVLQNCLRWRSVLEEVSHEGFPLDAYIHLAYDCIMPEENNSNQQGPVSNQQAPFQNPPRNNYALPVSIVIAALIIGGALALSCEKRRLPAVSRLKGQLIR